MTTTPVEQKPDNLPLYSIIVGVASLTMPFIGFFIAIGGIVLSTIATRRVTQNRNSDKGLAITGLCCSIASIVFHILFIFIYVVLILLGLTVASYG